MESLYTGWKRWGKKYSSKRKQKICYTALAIVVYYVWAARNHALWQAVVPCTGRVVKKIKNDVVWRARTTMADNWPAKICCSPLKIQLTS